MGKRKINAQLQSQQEIGKDIFDMVLKCSLAKEAKPGQFLCLYTQDASALLPRPISICEVDAKAETLRLVYRVAGKGTREFSTYQPGQEVPVLGCLGNGFPIEEAKEKNVWLMGGGIGIPPLLQLAKTLKEAGLPKEIKIIVGYRDKETFLQKDLEQYGEVIIATEDGSVGTKGNVMDAVREKNLQGDVIFSCGPMPMLRAIKTYAAEKEMPAYLSLEERMACGVGACLGCVAKTHKIDEHSKVHNARICTEGPVFEAKEVDI